jgi:hypothetical protein
MKPKAKRNPILVHCAHDAMVPVGELQPPPRTRTVTLILNWTSWERSSLTTAGGRR